jgi:hypothetical protein
MRGIYGVLASLHKKFYHHVHCLPPLDSVLGQLNPVHAHYFFKSLINIFPYLFIAFPNGLFILHCVLKYFICISYILLARWTSTHPIPNCTAQLIFGDEYKL